MATITSRKVVDDLIAGNGHYPGDPEPVLRIVEYSTREGLAWSILYPYATSSEWIESAALPGAKTIFDHEETTCERCRRPDIR